MKFQKSVLDHISQILLTKNLTIAVAESVTSGGLQLAFSQMQNASLFYKGGMTAYTLSEKVKLLQINQQEAEECDCVSEHISETMALNIARLFESDWSIATTGYCTTTRSSGFRLYIYFSFSYRGEIVLTEKLELHPQTEARDAQMFYVEYILGCFQTQMDKLS